LSRFRHWLTLKLEDAISNESFSKFQMFCYAALLLTMCRNTITNLRETFLHRLIPFDNFVRFHKYIAYMALFFTIVHVIGHAINFYHISTQTACNSFVFYDLRNYFPKKYPCILIEIFLFFSGSVLFVQRLLQSVRYA